MKKNVKGLSPVIATVLLVTMVIVIALIVFLWIRGMTEEAITKFGDKNIQLVCGEVSFEASSSENILYITNPGNVPIFGMNVKVIGTGYHETLDLREQSTWPQIGLNKGEAFSDSTFIDSLGDANEIVLIPVLIGESKSGRKTYVCDENQYGYQITL
jgi:flagellin-like protein